MKPFVLALALLCLAAIPIPSPKVLGTWPVKPPAPAPVWPVSPAEVWLAAGNTAPGTGIVTGDGSQTHPYWGDFDFILSNMPPACWIHGGPGRFRSACPPDLWLKTGQRFSGAGMGITTLWRDRSFSIPRDMSVLKGNANGITIEDVTLDPNGDPSDQAQRNGVNMFGNLCTVRRVEVVHATGSWTNGMECFPIFMGYGPPSYGNTVEQCYVHNPMGNYVSAIDLNGQGWVINNRVEFPNWPEGHFQCYLAAYSHDTLISGNISKGGNGFYTDTGDEKNLSICNNSFEDCLWGIVLFKAPGYSVDSLRIQDNNISVTTNYWQQVNNWTSIGIGIWMQTGTMSNVTVSGNSIRSVTTNGSSVWIIGIDTSKASNVRVENNLLSGGRMLVQPQAVISGNIGASTATQ